MKKSVLTPTLSDSWNSLKEVAFYAILLQFGITWKEANTPDESQRILIVEKVKTNLTLENRCVPFRFDY